MTWTSCAGRPLAGDRSRSLLDLRRALRGVRPAGPHKDLDLLYPAEDFTGLKRLLHALALEQIPAKRSRHKRAFVLDGVMVELFLVQHDEKGLFTNLWGRARHDWPTDALSSAMGLLVASLAALARYRAQQRALRRAP